VDPIPRLLKNDRRLFGLALLWLFVLSGFAGLIHHRTHPSGARQFGADQASTKSALGGAVRRRQTVLGQRAAAVPGDRVRAIQSMG
jgi:hypothetical protein